MKSTDCRKELEDQALNNSIVAALFVKQQDLSGISKSTKVKVMYIRQNINTKIDPLAYLPCMELIKVIGLTSQVKLLKLKPTTQIKFAKVVITKYLRKDLLRIQKN